MKIFGYCIQILSVEIIVFNNYLKLIFVIIVLHYSKGAVNDFCRDQFRKRHLSLLAFKLLSIALKISSASNPKES